MRLRKVIVGLLAAMTLATVAAPSATLAEEAPESPKISMENPMAAFLESREYAAVKGATAEFNKMEGVAVDPIRKKLYVAMSSVEKAMSDGKGDINLKENKCGVVYEADLDDNWNISSMRPLIEGGPYDPNGGVNRCDVNNMANPDNLFVDAQGNLWVGEDSGYHENNYLWRWDGKELKRFAATPLDSEITGLYVTANGDMFLNMQGPGAMNMHPYNRTLIGAVTGFNTKDDFKPLPVPTGDTQKMVTVATGSYQILGRGGELIPNDVKGERFGQRTMADGSVSICNSSDGNMFLPTDEAGTEGYLYTNFECRPGAVSKLYVRLDKKLGWQVLEGENVDFMPVGGTWNNCFASVTPWNTALTSEEYEAVVNENWQKNVSAMTAYLGEQANPYDYGYNVEMAPNGLGTRVVKRYAMGRFSHENALGMPDSRTFFQTDDGGSVVLFKFVADKAGDLSAGTLYAAEVTQVNLGEEDYYFKIGWVTLGHGTEEEISATIRQIDSVIGR